MFVGFTLGSKDHLIFYFTRIFAAPSRFPPFRAGKEIGRLFKINQAWTKWFANCFILLKPKSLFPDPKGWAFLRLRFIDSHLKEITRCKRDTLHLKHY